VHLEPQFQGWQVDCDYDRLGERTLRLPHGTIVSTDDHLAKSIYPDIVVHQREIPNNLLAIEVRKSSNHQPPEHDRHKLRALTDPHLWFAYGIGVYLVLGTNSVVSDVYVGGVIDGPLSAWLVGRLEEVGLDWAEPGRRPRANAASRQFRFGDLACQPRAQRRQPFGVVSPFADRRRIDRAPHLNGARGRRRRRALVKSQDLVVPRQSEKADEAPARCGLIADDVLVVDFQQHIRRQRRPPMPRQAAIGQIIFRQFDLMVRERKLALKVRLVDRPASVQRVSLDQYDPRRRQRRVNEAAIEVVLQRLVDETDILQITKRRCRIEITAADLRRRGLGRGIAHGTAHLGRERAGFPHRFHRGVAGDDPLDQCRAGARQPGDEHRRGGGMARRGGGNPAFRVGLDDPVDLGDPGRMIVRDRTVLQIAAGFDVIERTVVPIEVHPDFAADVGAGAAFWADPAKLDAEYKPLTDTVAPLLAELRNWGWIR